MRSFARSLLTSGMVVLVVLLALPLISARFDASGQQPMFVRQQSSHSFSATVSGLQHAISGNGMMVLGQLDQKSALSMTGLHLAGAHAFFVGNPVVGKQLFQADPAAGAVVPLRVYVWQDQGGQVYVGYFRPSELMAAVDPKLAKPGMMLDQKFTSLVSQATK